MLKYDNINIRITVMGGFVKTEVELVRHWEYKNNKKTRDYQPIEIDNNMQLPFCYLFNIYGEINTKVCFVSDFGGISKNIAYVDNNNILYAAFASNIIKYDLENNAIIKNIKNWEWIHNFFKFEDGFLLHQEMSVKFFDKDLNLLWEDNGCADIFANTIVEQDYEIGKGYISIIDWYGNKHYYNKFGKFKVERTPYNSDKYRKH